MGSGKYDRPITLQSPAVSPADDGGSTTTWTTYAEPFARFEPVSGNERLEDATDSALQTAKFHIRWFDGVSPRHRLLDQWGEAWDIIDVAEHGRGRDVIITAERREVSPGLAS